MNHRNASLFAYAGSVAAAVLAATLMTGNAYAEGPLDYPPSTPFVSARTRAEVKAELMQDRGQISSYASEYRLEQTEPMVPSGYTTAQARADYLASRDEVHAMTAEDSGSAWIAHSQVFVPRRVLAANGQE